MIGYRATVYAPRSQNDAAESIVLTPAAGAPHADEFRVTTLPEFSEGIAVTDTFTRPDNAASLGLAETGQSYTVHQGTGGISGNEAYFTTNTDGNRATLDTGEVDGDFRLLVRSSAWSSIWGGMIFRGIDGDDFLLLQVEGANIRLYKFDAGVFTQLQSAAFAPVNGTGYTLRADCAGASITCYRDATPLFTHTLTGADLTKFTAAGASRMGFRSSGGGAGTLRFDGLSFVSAGEGAVTWRPYLAVPQGRAGAINPLTKKTDIGTWSLELLDKKLGADNLERWLTAFVGDVKGRPNLGGCKVVVEECLDWDPDTLTGTWLPYAAGRIKGPSKSRRLWARLDVRDFGDDLKFNIFTRAPHPSATYAFMPTIWPLALTRKWGGFPADLAGIDGTVIGSSAGICEIRLDRGRDLERTVSLVFAKLAALDGVAAARDVRRTTCRVTLTRLDTLASGELYMGHPTLGTTNRGHYRIDVLRTNPLPVSDPLYIAHPPVGTRVRLTVRPLDVPPSATVPLLIDDVHPVQLMKDIALGYFGALRADGSPALAVPIDEAAFDALIADPTFPTARFLIDKARPANSFLEEQLCKPWGIGYRFDEAGRLAPVDHRLSGSRTIASTITDDDLIATEEGAGWEQDASEAVVVTAFSYRLDRHGAAFVPIENDVSFPDVSSVLIESTEVPDIDVALTDRALDFGPGLKKYEVQAEGLRYAVSGEPAVGGISRELAIKRHIARIRGDIAGPYGSGPITTTLRCRRGSAAAQAAVPGSLHFHEVSTVPNPATGALGGRRVGLCVKVANEGIARVVTLLDAGPDATAAAPTLGAPALTADRPSSALTVALTINTDGARAEIWAAVTETSVGVRPAEGAAAWYLAATAASSATVILDGLPSRKRIWLRARTVPGLGDAPKVASPFAFPSSGTGYVDTTAIAAPGGTSVTDITARTARFNFTPADEEHPLQILLTTGTAPATWTDDDVVEELAPGSTHYDLEGLDVSAQHTVGVRAIDSHGGTSTVAAVTFATTAALPKAPTPRAIRIAQGVA